MSERNKSQSTESVPVAESVESVTPKGFDAWWKDYVNSGRHQYHELLHPDGIAKQIAKDAWDEAVLSTPHSEAVEAKQIVDAVMRCLQQTEEGNVYVDELRATVLIERILRGEHAPAGLKANARYLILSADQL